MGGRKGGAMELNDGVASLSLGVILADSVATDSNNANCCRRFAETGISVAMGRARYGEISAVDDFRNVGERGDMGGLTEAFAVT
jgi:hypothetical protein